MPLSCLNCCRGGGDSTGKKDGAASEINGNVSYPDGGGGGKSDGLLRGAMPCAEEEGRDDEPVYAVVAKDRSGRLVPVPGADGKKAKKGECTPKSQSSFTHFSLLIWSLNIAIFSASNFL